MTGICTVSVVIPVHNEQEILEATTRTVIAGIRSLEGAHLVEVILSENGSTDRTREAAQALAEELPEVKVLFSDAPDYGGAMRRGFEAASGECVVNFDADYYDFDFVRQALQIDAGIVVAAKNIEGSSDDRRLARKLVSHIFGWLVRRSLGISTSETHGIKLYRLAALREVLAEVTSTQDLFDTELVARAELAGIKVVELPITTRELRASRSSILRRIPRTVVGLLKLRHRLRPARAKAKAGV